jgi:hypothetical protein
MARLIATAGLSTELHSGKVSLGKGPGVDVTLPAGLGIAKVHAELCPLLGGYVIKHLGGDAFQTLVNDKSVATIANLTSGDNIRIGALPLTLVLEDEPAAKEPAPTVEVPTVAKATLIEEETPSIPFPGLTTPSVIQTPPEETLTESRPKAQPETAPPVVKVSLGVDLSPSPPPSTPGIVETNSENEIPPIPEAHSEPVPSPGNDSLPPLPPNLAEAAPSPGNDTLPPLPPNLAEAAPFPGNDTLPPLPPNLAETVASPGNDTLPPLPPNLAEAVASPGNDELPLIDPAHKEQSFSSNPTASAPEPMPWDDSQPVSSDPNQSVTVKLAPPDRPVERARRRSPLIEFAVPGFITLLLIIGGIIFLQQHKKRLARQIESELSPVHLGKTTEEPPEIATPAVAESELARALEKLNRERKRPRHHEFPAENFVFKAPGKD